MPRHSVELGWMNLPPCTKVDWVDSSIPGVKVPVLRTAAQELHAYAEIETDKFRDDALTALKDCALAAVGAAGGIGAITANPGAALGAFKLAFLACFSAKAADIAVMSVNIHTDTRCNW